MKTLWLLNSDHMIDGQPAVLFSTVANPLRSLGWRCVRWSKVGRDDPPADAALVLRVKPESAEARSRAEAAGVPVLFIENGWFLRVFSHIRQQPERYLQACWGGLCSLDSDIMEERGMRYDETRFGRIEETKEFDRRKPILVLGQVPEDAQHGMHHEEMSRWYVESVASFLRANLLDPEHPVLFRPHPSCPAYRDLFGRFLALPNVTVRANGTLAGAIRDCGGVIGINSTAMLEAVRLGYPILGTWDDGMLAPMRGSKGYAERHAFLELVARHQWTLHELGRVDTWRTILSRMPL